MKIWTDEQWVEHLGPMRNWTDKEWAQYLGDVKPDGEYTEEEIQTIWDEQVRIDKENEHKRKHAKLQTLLDASAIEFEKGGSDSH